MDRLPDGNYLVRVTFKATSDDEALKIKAKIKHYLQVLVFEKLVDEINLDGERV